MKKWGLKNARFVLDYIFPPQPITNKRKELGNEEEI